MIACTVCDLHLLYTNDDHISVPVIKTQNYKT